MNDEPLVYTTKGNLPVSSLRYETSWHDGVEQMIFRERYFLGDELVRENCHILKREGVTARPEQATL